MKRQAHIYLLFFLVALGSVSCVSKKKYAELENLKNNIQTLLDDNEEELTDSERNAADLHDKLKKSQSEFKQLAAVNDQQQKDLESMNTRMEEMQTSCDDLNERYKKLKTQSSQKIQDLIDDLETLQTDLAQREKRLNELEAELNRRDSALNSLRNSLNEALVGFSPEEMTVETKDGKVYVTLTNKLLFKSGSTKVDAKGQEALKEVGKVLAEKQDITIMVEGHTDNVPVSNLGDIKDNWDLSVMRSTEVVRLLVESGIEPVRILPAGRGEFFPKAEGDEPEARAQNRRTEIILTPQYDVLYDLLQAENKDL